MLGGMREFGKRNRIERKSDAAPDFKRDRPMYERVRMHNSTIDRLFTELEALEAQHDRVFVDQREQERIQKQIAEAYKTHR